MNASKPKSFGPEGRTEAEETLRLIAALPAPEGLEDRVHAALAKAPHQARILAWPLDGRSWLQSTMMRGAAAAAIVCVVAGGGWAVYSRVRPAETPSARLAPSQIGPGGFSSANAIRTPKTLDRPVLTHAIEKDDGAAGTQPVKAKKQAKKRAGSAKTAGAPVR